MAEVDISGPANRGEGGGGKGGLFGLGIPTPILLALVGGGVGLIVFLTSKANSAGSNAGGSSSSGTLLPNTAIMLGSLQQGVQQIQGDVTTGNANLSTQIDQGNQNLSDLVTGVGENLSAQIDTNAAAEQQAFSDLNTYLAQNFGNVAGADVSLSTAIAGLATQNTSLADGLATTLSTVTGIQGTDAQILNGVNQTINTQTVTTANLNALGQAIGMTQAEIAQVESGLGGSIGTSKGEILTLAYALGKGQSVQQYLSGQGDQTQSGQTHEG